MGSEEICSYCGPRVEGPSLCTWKNEYTHPSRLIIYFAAIPGLFRFEKVELEYLQKEGTTKSYHFCCGHPLMCNVWKTQQIQWQYLYHVHASL